MEIKPEFLLNSIIFFGGTEQDFNILDLTEVPDEELLMSKISKLINHQI